MKIMKSVRDQYDDILGLYSSLEAAVGEKIRNNKSPRWHYESRIKQIESYALKLETGRESDPNRPEDMFGCTIVVENHTQLQTAEDMVGRLFELRQRRPPSPTTSHLAPENFGFDDLRLYVRWVDSPSVQPKPFAGISFEVQVKTFLQHAWGIATHDLVYKPDNVNWATSRIAYQVKAMLENAEISIAEAGRLAACGILARADKRTNDLLGVIRDLRQRWDPGLLPRDIRRLAENVITLASAVSIDIKTIWMHVDAASEAGRGARLVDLSPYSCILNTLLDVRGAALFEPLGDTRSKTCLFVPLEVELPELRAEVRRKIVRPKALLSQAGSSDLGAVRGS